MSQNFFSLTEIAQWGNSNKKFDLPNVQRGFVWKPNQVEDLWDSILREYPIGCFVLAKLPENNNETYLILDGQQRAISIALGFNSKTLREGIEENIKLFIDLDYDQSDKESKKYLFRVITKAHPWGYDKRDNTKTLDSNKIRSALQLYGIDNHLEVALELFIPFEASFPVPFSFLIKAKGNGEAFSKIKQWKLFDMAKDRFLLQQNDKGDFDFEKFLAGRINNIMEKIDVIIQAGKSIPALYLPSKFITRYYSNKTIVNLSEENDEGVDTESSDEIENLFIRLNKNGTPLGGEELNYSILKAHISKELQVDIENACKNLMKPSRFVSIIFRVFTNEPNSQYQGNYSLKIKAKVFQQAMAKDKSKFSSYLKKILSEKIYENKTLLDYSKYVLSYDMEKNRYGFPYIIYTGIGDRAPEVMFALIYRIKVKGDRFNSQKQLQMMLGTISLFYFLGKGDKNRNYAKLLRNIWPSLSKMPDVGSFWSKSTINRARINQALSFFPKFNGRKGLKAFLLIRIKNKRSNRDPFIVKENEEVLLPFINATLDNKDIIAYSQRNFLHKQFQPIHYGLDDTNVPFDWDHISPKNAIAIKPIPKPIQSAYSTIGNLRAWPFSLNRIDKDYPPHLKFNPLEGETNQNQSKNLKKYGKILKEEILNQSELRKNLLEESICNKEWENCTAEKLRSRTEWEKVYDLIIKRCIILYKNWYESLPIDDLYPTRTSVNFDKIFYKGQWHKNPKDDHVLNEFFDFDSDDFWLSNPIMQHMQIYFGYTRGKELEPDEFYFGLVEKSTDGYLKKVRIPVKLNNRYLNNIADPCMEIYGIFTLLSSESLSYQILINEIFGWVKHFNDKRIKEAITDYLKKSLKKEYKELIEMGLNHITN